MSLVRSKDLVTYSSPRSRYPMRPMRMSGVGLALVISLAMDQIFCLAPSMRSFMEPVVSSTKQTSIFGLSFIWDGGSLANAVRGKSQIPNTKHQRNPNIQIPIPPATAPPWSLRVGAPLRYGASGKSRHPSPDSTGDGAALRLEPWSFSGVWSLVFGAFSLPSVNLIFTAYLRLLNLDQRPHRRFH